MQLQSLSQVSSLNLASTFQETSLLTKFIGSEIIKENTLERGSRLSIRASGVLSTPHLSVGALTVRFKFGSTTLVSCASTDNLLSNLSNKGWLFEVDAVLQEIGNQGRVMAQGKLSYHTVLASLPITQGVLSTNVSPTLVDTTKNIAMNLTGQWSNASANSLIVTNLSIDVF